MIVAAVPDDDDPTAQVLEQLPHKPGGCDCLEMVIDERAEIQTEMAPFGRKGQCRHQRNFMVVSALVFEDRRLALGGQRATHERREQQTALVDENQMGP